jgi:hypothetical protein
MNIFRLRSYNGAMAKNALTRREKSSGGQKNPELRVLNRQNRGFPKTSVFGKATSD